jgi:hypothetical protein
MQKYVFGIYTSLAEGKNYFKVSLNAQYNFKVRLPGVKKTWFCLAVEDDGENLFSPWSKILDRATLGFWKQVF